MRRFLLQHVPILLLLALIVAAIVVVWALAGGAAPTRLDDHAVFPNVAYYGGAE